MKSPRLIPLTADLSIWQAEVLERLCEIIAPEARLSIPWRDIGFVEPHSAHFDFANPVEIDLVEELIELPPPPAQRSLFTPWARHTFRWLQGRRQSGVTPRLGSAISCDCNSQLDDFRWSMSSQIAAACGSRPLLSDYLDF